ncbi:hypothetical protein [Trichocoleus sp. FACHB-262]|uniref:hypothetical protein n=1 Tax=Trichocoleus sp. FACHB-262 TaxID=2692869 RepID=UPI0016897348|nr:hypothetical protein [Trichocoleus sp. FACHB-262]MBD2123952.1 hypothetical protein [Trichocoleus sp. FACHB-262]
MLDSEVNPKLKNLELGRGKRPKLDNPTVAMRMSEDTRNALEAIAEQYGCMYGGKPWIAGLLTKIGIGELIVVPAPPKGRVGER